MKQNKPQKPIWRIIIGGAIGSLTEWYNFLLYGFLAPVISHEFFPSQNKLLSLIFVFGIFAVSFLVRPVGGLLFGYIGDTFGRQRALLSSLFMLGLPSLIISILPTYHTIGMISPIILSLCRIIQGLSAGGEHTGSAIYLAEYAPATRRALWISAIPASAALGVLISSGTSLLIVNSLDHQQLLSWGWRLAYGIGTLLCLISIVLRLGLPETPSFKELQRRKEQKAYSISEILRDKSVLKNFSKVIILAGGWGIFYQILFVWMPSYLIEFEHFNHPNALLINSFSLLCFTLLIVLMGYWADWMNRKLLLIISLVAFFLFAYPLFMGLSAGILWLTYCIMALFTLLFSIFIPSALVIMIEMFAVNIRYTALSLAFNIGLAVFGGTCPLIATGLIELTHNKSSPAIYMMLAALFSLLVSMSLQVKRDKFINPLKSSTAPNFG